MALDKGLVQNISLQANGDQLLGPLRAYGREINKITADLQKMLSGFNVGASKQDNALRAQVQLLQRLVGEANTLQKVLDSSSNRKRDGLFAGLEDQAMGRRAASASRLKRELTQTSSAADALELKLGKLHQRFASLAQQGRRVGQQDLSKAMNTEQAIRDVRRLEEQISRLDRRRSTLNSQSLSADGNTARASLQAAQDTLLRRAQSNHRVNFTTEIAQVETLTAKYRALVAAEQQSAIASERAAMARRRAALSAINLSPSELQANVNRQSSGFAFTREQARGFDMLAINRQISEGTANLQRYQQAMSRAMQTGRSQAVIDRLAGSFEALKQRVAEAIAMRKAFDALPEQRMKALNEALFGGGGAAFMTRIAGASAMSMAAFAGINAIMGGLRHVVQYEDELVKLQAIAGATDQEMRGMAESIMEVARSSRYSTVEIIQSATAIAQAGFSAAETSSVLKDALTLATASGSTPTESVDTLTSALGAFQLQASESTRVVDTLVQGLNRSKLTINQMQQAIQYAGATAFENSIRFEELVAVAGSLANAGIRSGSTIGTGLRQLMVDLKTPTENFKRELEVLGLTLADVDVKALGMAEVVRRMTEAGFSAEAAYASFEVRAASSFLAFRNQIGVYDELALAVAQSGAAAVAAERASNSLQAQWQELLNNVNELVSQLAGPLSKGFTVIVSLVSDLVGGFVQLNRATEGIAGKVAIISAAFMMGGPWGAAIAAITMMIGELNGASSALENLQAASNQAEQTLDSSEQTVTSLSEAISTLITRENTLKDNKAALTAETITLTTRFEGLSSHIKGAATSYDELLAAMMKYRGEAAKQASENARTARIAAADEALGYATELGQAPTLGYTFDRAEMRGNRTYQRGLGLIQSIPTQNFRGASVDTLRSMAFNLQKTLNDLREMGSSNQAVIQLIQQGQTSLSLMQQLISARSREQQFLNQEQTYAVNGSDGAQRIAGMVNNAQRGVDEGLRRNKEAAGTGEALINETIRTANAQIAVLKQHQAAAPADSVQANVLGAYIMELQSQVSRITRSRAAEAEEVKAPKDLRQDAGQRLTSDQVAAEVQRLIPGARITNTTRTPAQQKAWSPNTRDPNSAPHVVGNALDMAIMKNVDPMQVVEVLEKMGLQVTQAPVRKDGVSYINPNHGTAPHWHFAWKAKATQFEQAKDSQAEKEARELQSLMKEQAKYQVGTAQARVDTVQAQAKAGTTSIRSVVEEFEAALEGLKAAKLASFDIENPLAGLSSTLASQRELARKALEEQITQEAVEAHANLWRSIGDFAGKELEAAMTAAANRFDQTQFDIEDSYAGVVSHGATLDNYRNRNRFGEGHRYAQKRDEFQARLGADRQLVEALKWKELEQGVAVDGFRTQFEQTPDESETKLDLLKKLAEAEQALIATQQEREQVQRSINERTQEYTEIPFKQGLKDSVAAWADSSGAMQEWGAMIQNNVGPILDNLTNNMATLFTSIIDGTKSVKQALGSFVEAFGRFVLQIIAKALALMAIKAILSLFNLNLQSGPGGTVIGKIPKASFNGGPVEVAGSRYGGGVIDRGLPTRDSALYNLAKGEYVIRNKAVSDIGLKNMDMINRFGKAGLDKVAGAGSAFTNIQAPKQETNVWVVAERQQAQMGPSDVLVTIHEDILQGGPTKKLIRQVAQGG